MSGDLHLAADKVINVLRQHPQQGKALRQFYFIGFLYKQIIIIDKFAAGLTGGLAAGIETGSPVAPWRCSASNRNPSDLPIVGAWFLPTTQSLSTFSPSLNTACAWDATAPAKLPPHQTRYAAAAGGFQRKINIGSARSIQQFIHEMQLGRGTFQPAKDGAKLHHEPKARNGQRVIRTKYGACVELAPDKYRFQPMRKGG